MKKFSDQLEKLLAGQKRYKKASENIIFYAKKLTDNGFPPLVDISFLSEFTSIDISILCSAISSPKSFYRQFKIPKKRGGERIIDAPIPSLLTCQRWIAQNLLENIDLADNATGYRKGFNLLKNIEPHLGQKELLKLDLQDFFPSIELNRVISVFINMGYLPKMSFELASLCCLNGRLPQGAATSPLISNIIAKRLDLRLAAVANKHSLNYTRFSDDLTFSGKKIPRNIISFLELIIEDEGFHVNKVKTRLHTKPGKRIVTGISVNGNQPKLPRISKRNIKQDFYELIEKENYKTIIFEGGKDVFFLDSLKGKLNFWHQIEPNANFPIIALKKLNAILTNN